MKQKKIQQAPHKHNHTRTPNLTWKALQCREKNHGIAPKNIHYEIKITTIKFMLNLSPQIGYTINESQGVNTISPQSQ